MQTISTTPEIDSSTFVAPKIKKKKVTVKDIAEKLTMPATIQIYGIKDDSFVELNSFTGALKYLNALYPEFVPNGYESLGVIYIMATLLANKKFRKVCQVKIYSLQYQN